MAASRGQPAAVAALERVIALDPAYADAAALLDQVREGQREAKAALAAGYAEGQRAIAAGEWPAAVAALSEPVFVSVTVLLEFEWVLRGFYCLPRKRVIEVLRSLAGIEQGDVLWG